MMMMIYNLHIWPRTAGRRLDTHDLDVFQGSKGQSFLKSRQYVSVVIRERRGIKSMTSEFLLRHTEGHQPHFNPRHSFMCVIEPDPSTLPPSPVHITRRNFLVCRCYVKDATFRVSQCIHVSFVGKLYCKDIK